MASILPLERGYLSPGWGFYNPLLAKAREGLR
jgi:hypothetical protein